jgi:hypothetical protein
VQDYSACPQSRAVPETEADLSRWHDLHGQAHDDVLGLVERWLSLVLDRAGAVYGNSGRTAGFLSDQGTWVRLQWRSAVVDASGSVTTMPDLAQDWWDSLAGSLAALGAHHTDRIGMRQEHLSARIREVFGDAVDTAVDQWAGPRRMLTCTGAT